MNDKIDFTVIEFGSKNDADYIENLVNSRNPQFSCRAIVVKYYHGDDHDGEHYMVVFWPRETAPHHKDVMKAALAEVKPQ